MSIDKDTVKHISKLARISLDENKVESLSKDLTSIMKFIERLNKLNTDKTTPLTSIINASLKSDKPIAARCRVPNRRSAMGVSVSGR